MVTDTFQLISAVKKMYPVVQFFKDRYFPDGRTYYSDKVLVETKKQGRRIAPFVIPVIGGIKMESQSYRAYEYDAPYIAPYMLITPEDISKKAFGESPDSNRSPADRENEVQGEKMDDLRNSVLRREEEMCTQVLCNGEVVMRHYGSAEDAAAGKNYQEKILRFYDVEEGFTNRYRFPSDFAKMTAKEKLLELYKMAGILRGRGIRATDLVMTADVSMLFMSDPDFLEYYDKARVNTGQIDQKELPSGVVCNGCININGVVFTMFTYDEVFEDLDGTQKAFLPKGTILLLHSDMGRAVHAQVTFLQGDHFVSYAERMVPRVLPDTKNNMIRVQIFSRPVIFVHDWESWIVANIYDAAKDGGTGGSTPSGGQPSGTLPAVPPGEDDGERITLKTADEINAMTTKAPLLEYAQYIGLEGLSTDLKVDELKAAILNYQEETYGA